MSKKSRADYNRDLQIFYKTFTGKTDYSRWNASGKKKFGDIPLIAYHETEQCKDPNSAWQQSYEGRSDNPLFVKFADNIKNMLVNTKKNQGKLLAVLDKLFVWIDTPTSKDSSLDNKAVTINPLLTSKSLQSLIEETRKLIINIYLQCEKEYQEGLKLFEAIVGERILKNSIAKKKALEVQLENVIVGDDPALQKIIQQNVNTALEPPRPRQSGGTRKKKRK